MGNEAMSNHITDTPNEVAELLAENKFLREAVKKLVGVVSSMGIKTRTTKRHIFGQEFRSLPRVLPLRRTWKKLKVLYIWSEENAPANY